MATVSGSHQVIAAGISGGVGIVLPIAAYAATLPLESVNDVVRSSIAPFTVGALAGVGLCAVTAALIEHDADRREVAALREEEARRADQTVSPFSGAPVQDSVGVPAGMSFAVWGDGSAQGGGAASVPAASEPASSVVGADPAVTNSVSAGSPAPSTAFASAVPHERVPHITGAFRRRLRAEDVPVISRAQGALSEEDAWAEIDSMLDDDSPVSCDASRSKDIYQIALEELVRSQQAASASAAQTAAASAGAYAGAEPSAPSPTTPAPMLQMPSASVAQGAAQGAFEHPAEPLASGAAYGAAAPQTFSAVAEPIPVVDYSAHHAMWAEALAILAEDESSTSSPAPARASMENPATAFDSMPTGSVASTQAPVAASASQPLRLVQDVVYTPTADVRLQQEGEPVFARDPFTYVPDDYLATAAASVDAYRRANGGAAPQFSYAGSAYREPLNHIDAIVAEEQERLMRERSATAGRRTGHDFLRVVDGGTNPLPRLRNAWEA